MSKRIFLIILFYAFCGKLAGSDQPNTEYVVVELSAEDGLSQNDARVVIQDRAGFIWIGTNDGINRYDGYEFKTFRIGDRGLTSNLVRDIAEDIDGNLWIGTEDGGLIHFDTTTETFKNVYENTGTDILLPTYVSTVLADGQGNTWIRADERSIYRFRYNSGLGSFEIKQIPLPVNERLKQIKVDPDGRMTLLTHNGLLAYDENSPGQFRFSHAFGDITDIQWKNGHTFILKNGRAYRYETDEDRYVLLSDIRASKMVASADNKLWLQNPSGIYCVNLDIRDTDHRTSLITENSHLVTTMMEDIFGNVWIGTYRRGVMLIYRNQPFRTHMPGRSVECVWADSYGKLWVGEVTGLISRYEDVAGNGPVTIRLPDSARTYIQDICEHKRAGQVFISNKYGIYYAYIAALPGYGIFSRLSITDSCHLSEDGPYMWISSFGGGLSLFNTETEVIERTLMASPEGLPSNTVRHTLLDRNNNLWVSTMQGLVIITAESRFSPTPQFRRVTFRNDSENILNNYYVLPVHESVSGDIWVGTLGMGLYRLSGIDEDFVCDAELLTTEDGLSNNIIRGILEDDLGNIWVSTTRGLNSISPGGKIRSFTKKDGLQDYEFRDLSCAKLNTGELAFGGLGGLSIFDPEQIRENKIVPTLVITDFQVNNRSIRVGEEVRGNVILKNRLGNNSSIKLKHQQNSFTFYFSSLHYKVPENSRYQYMLAGHDKEWIETSSAYRMAKYSNLPPGRYVFAIKGSNNDNTWSETISIDLTILAPIWARWYAYVLYVTAAVLTVLLSIRSYLKKQRIRDEIELAKREKQYLQELHESKITFFTNVSHEFRTPLTLILSPLQKLMEDINMPAHKREKLLKAIDQNSNILLRLVNQTMDFAKQDKEKLVLDMQKTDIISYAREVFGKFGYLAGDKNITLYFSTDSESSFLEFDRDQMEKVLFNLISNAIKHTPGGGSVQCKIADMEDKVCISVIDDGSGIEESTRDHIFDHFFSGDSKTGTGIGLALTRKLVEMHGGTIECESFPGEGATFRVSLPKVRPAVDKAEDAELSDPVIPDSIVEEPPVNMEDGKASVLIVDDSREIVDLLENLMKDRYHILKAYSGRQGLEKCIRYLPTLVIADVMMPDMDGLQMCASIKNNPLVSHIPVLMLTAKASEENQNEGFKVLADAYCPKPFENKVLLAMISSLIANRRNIADKLRNDFIYNSANIKVNTMHDDFIGKLVGLIDEHLSSVDISVSYFAQKLGVSQNVLNRKLKETTGHTAIAFVRSVKLKRAAEMLATSQYTVQEVTYATGFSDLKYFRECFKKEFGVVPSEFTAKGEAPGNAKTETV